MLFAVFFFSSMKKVRILSLYCLEIAGIQKNSGIDRIFLLLKFLQSVLISVCIAWLRRPSLPTHSLFLVLSFRPTLDVLCVNANFSAKFLSNSVLESKNLILNILLFGPHPAITELIQPSFRKASQKLTNFRLNLLFVCMIFYTA